MAPICVSKASELIARFPVSLGVLLELHSPIALHFKNAFSERSFKITERLSFFFVFIRYLLNMVSMLAALNLL